MGIRKFLSGKKYQLAVFHNAVKSVANGKWDYLSVASDLFFCKIHYKVQEDEYCYYGLYNYRNRYRKNFLLAHHRKKFININTKAFTRSKYVFYTFIPDLFSREIILAPRCGEDTFVAFLKKHQKIIVKPDSGSLGKGISIVEYTDDDSARQYFANIPKNDHIVCEEIIRQHPALAQLNPASVNSIRITSLLVNGEVEILSAAVKSSFSKTSITDNLSLGGIGAQIDIPTGIVSTFGKDFDSNTYTHHPVTGTQIIGMQIPNWDIAINLVKEAHKRLPHCTLYGWDIAITETGADIIEANSKPGIRNTQAIDQIPRGEKIIPLLRSKDLIKDKRKEYLESLREHYREYWE